MQVNRVQAATQSQLAAVTTGNQADFQAALDAANQNIAGTGVTHKTAGEELAEYQSKSLAQHLRDAILKEMGVTEEQRDAMPPEQRAAIEETIAEKIEQRLLAEGGDAQGAVADPAASLLSLLTQVQAAVDQPSQVAVA